jgi:hypothetical protein
MRRLFRALPALLIGATLLAPVSPASAGAWTCSFYRWDEPTQEWDLVAHLRPQKEFKETHVYLVDWHCEYCVPALVARDPDHPFEYADAQEVSQYLVAEVAGTVRELQLAVPSPGSASPGELALVDPWNYPPCPKVPPVWDEDALDAVGGIG